MLWQFNSCKPQRTQQFDPFSYLLDAAISGLGTPFDAVELDCASFLFRKRHRTRKSPPDSRLGVLGSSRLLEHWIRAAAGAGGAISSFLCSSECRTRALSSSTTSPGATLGQSLHYFMVSAFPVPCSYGIATSLKGVD